MMTTLGVYFWLHLVPTLAVVGLIVGITGVIVGFIMLGFAMFGTEGGGAYSGGVWQYDKNGNERKACRKAGVWTTIICFMFLIIGIICPNRRTIILCHVIPAVANSEIMEELPDDINKLYQEGMDNLHELVRGE
jgi:hypothetical protein